MIRVIRVIIRVNINIHERCQLHSPEGSLKEVIIRMNINIRVYYIPAMVMRAGARVIAVAPDPMITT